MGEADDDDTPFPAENLYPDIVESMDDRFNEDREDFQVAAAATLISAMAAASIEVPLLQREIMNELDKTEGDMKGTVCGRRVQRQTVCRRTWSQLVFLRAPSWLPTSLTSRKDRRSWKRCANSRNATFN